MKKRHFKSVMLALCMLVSFNANAHDFEVDGIYYNILTTTEVEVAFRGNSYNEYSDEYRGKVEIPESVTYNGKTYSVTSIGMLTFYYCTGLTSINIPNSVASIGDKAFLDCYGLTSITIPNSVTSIGDDAFYACTGLTSITVDDGNAVYDSRENCNAIIEKETNSLILGCKNTTIPNSVTSIGDYAFSVCTGLTSITIPNSVTSIERGAFHACN